jgi:hypothetical protein
MSNKTRTIDVAREYSDTPGGRYRDDGPYSGEEFRDKILIPALTSYAFVIVELSHAKGFAGSFLEEVFGGAVRKLGPEIAGRIKIVSESRPGRALRAMAYLQAAVDEAAK